MMKARKINPAKLHIHHFQRYRIREFILWASGDDGGAGMAACGNADSVLLAIERHFGPDRPPIEGESTGADVPPPQPRCPECGTPVSSAGTVCPACHDRIVDDLKRLEGA